MTDYPDALKNFDELLRKKIIDIANALLDSGYDEGTTIPIAIEQGKEWYENADDEEKRAFDEADDPKKSDDHDTDSTNPDLLDNDVEVFYEDGRWKVKTKGADQADQTFETKEEAIDRAKEIADNRDTKVITYRMDGTQQ